MHSIKIFAAVLTGLTLTSAAQSRGVEDAREALAALAGPYQLVRTVYGSCQQNIFLGMGRDASSYRAGPYQFNAVNMGRQRINDSRWEGWSKTSLRRNELETESKLRSRMTGESIIEETELELEDGLVELEHDKDIRSHRNHTKIRNKCLYARDYGGGSRGGDDSDQGQGGK